MLSSMTASGDTRDKGETLNTVEINGRGSAKRTVHNQIERKRKDRLKEDIEDIRKLIPDSNFVLKKLTHHEVMRAACEYICSLQQQNNELLLGKKEEVSVSVIEKLRKENNELKSENKKFREIIENADFPPLADLSQLVLSWKPRSSSITTTATKTGSAEVAQYCTVEKKKKKQGLTVSECLKRQSESINKNQKPGTGFASEHEHVTEEVVSTASIVSSQLEFTESPCGSSKAIIASELKHCSVDRVKLADTSCQSAASHLKIISVHKTIGEVLNNKSNSDNGDLIVLSELIASEKCPVDLVKTDSATTSTDAIEETALQTILPHVANVSCEQVLMNISDEDKKCKEPIEDESHLGAAISMVNIMAADAESLPTVQSEQSMLLVTQEKVETCPPKADVCLVSCDNTSCASVSNIISENSENVNLTIAPMDCSLQPLRVISLNTSSTSVSHSDLNNVVVHNSKEHTFSKLDIGNNVLGSGLVYGNFIYHNGQLVLSQRKTNGAASSLQYILPNVPQSVFCSQTLPSATVLLPSPQVIPVYFQTAPLKILAIAQEIPEITVLPSTGDCVSQVTPFDIVLNDNNKNCSSIRQTQVNSYAVPFSIVDVDLNAKANKLGLDEVTSPGSDGLNVNASRVRDINPAFEVAESVQPGAITACDHNVEASLSSNDTIDGNLEASSTVIVTNCRASIDGNCGVSIAENILVNTESSLGKTTHVVLNNIETKVLTTECASSKKNDIQLNSGAGSVYSTGPALLANSGINSKVGLPVTIAYRPCSGVADDYVKTATQTAKRPSIDCSNESAVSKSNNSGSVQDADIELSAHPCSSLQPCVEPSVSDNLVSCQSRVCKNTLAVEPLSTVFTTGTGFSGSVLAKATVNKSVEPTPWNGPMLIYSSNACSGFTSSRPVFHNTNLSYQASPVVASSDLNDIHRGYKRKSSTTLSQSSSKSQKIFPNFAGNVSRYICPPPDSVVEKDKSLEIYVLDQLNCTGKIGIVDCPQNNFGDLLSAKSSTNSCIDIVTDISNSLPAALPAVDEFWRPDAEHPSVMQVDMLRNKQQLATSAVNVSRSVASDSEETMKFASTISTNSFPPIFSHEPITLFSNDKSEKAASLTMKNKSFTLASFFPASQSSLIEFSGLSNLDGLVAPKSPRNSELSHSFLADCGLPGQNFYSHVPKSLNSVMYGDSFYNSLQDDLSLTDNDLSVFLNDADVFPLLPVKTSDQNTQFWNAGISVSNSKVREKGKDMGLQFCKADANASVGTSFSDSYRVDWNANPSDQGELNNNATARNFFNVTSLTSKPSTSNHPLWSYNVDQQHGSHLPVHQMQASSSAQFESFNIPTSVQCQITEQIAANAVTNFSPVSANPVSINREIFSLARHAVSSSGNHSTGVTSSKISRTCATAVANCFWSPCASSSYSVASNKTTPANNLPLYHKNTHTLSSLCSSNVSKSVPKQSFWGLQLATGDQDADAIGQASDSRVSCFHYDSLHATMPVTTQHNLSGSDVVQPTTVSLSFRPQIEHEISTSNCRWSEEEFYPFPAARKTTAMTGDRSCRTSLSNRQPFYPHATTTAANNTDACLNSVKPVNINMNNDQKLPTKKFSHYSSEGSGSNSGLGFPIGLPQSASDSVSCHKLPSFSFAAVPPIPDFMTFNFAPAVSLTANQSSTQSTLGSQWNFSSSTRSQNINKQPLTFAISNQLTSFEQANCSVASSVCRSLSPLHENIVRRQKSIGSSQSVVLPTPFISATSQRQQDDFFLQSGAYSGSSTHPNVSNVNQSSCSGMGIVNVNNRTCPDSTGTAFADYCLTSPPLHHPPVLNSVGLDNCSAKQLKLSTSFAIPNLTLAAPPMLSFSAPPPFQPAAQIIGIGNNDVYGGCNNSLSQTSHLRSPEFLFPTHGFAESQQPLKSKKLSKFSKRSPKHTSDSYTVSLPVYNSQNNGLRQPELSEMPTYLTNAPFSHNGICDSAEVNECQTSGSLNPVFGPSMSNGLTLNSLPFQPTTGGSTLHMPTTHGHLHNFGIGSIFSDMSSSSSATASPIRDLRLPPIRLLHAPGKPTSSPQLRHNRSVGQDTFNAKATQSSAMHNMSINSLLGRDQRALLPNHSNSTTSDNLNSASMSQFSSPALDFGVYSHHL